MRARGGLAQALWATGQHDEAIGHYRELLRFNPGDNQGIRYLLAACLLDLDRDDDLLALLESYGPECTADWAYTTALAKFRREGDTPSTRKLLKEAMKTNQHVPDYLVGAKKVPVTQAAYISMGGEDEAQEYAGRNAPSWARSQGALDWLMNSMPLGRKSRRSK